MDFSYAGALQREPGEAYEELFLDAMCGDAKLFARRDGDERAWPLVTPILQDWGARSEEPAVYEPASKGPPLADAPLCRTGRRWRPLDGKKA